MLVAKETIEFANGTIAAIDRVLATDSLNVNDRICAVAERKELVKNVGLSLRVISQTERRVFNEESVPSREKLVSIFESTPTSS